MILELLRSLVENIIILGATVIGAVLDLLGAAWTALVNGLSFLNTAFGVEFGKMFDYIGIKGVMAGTVGPALLKIVFVLAILFGIAPLLVWAERRQSAMMQDRIGPVRAGIPLPPIGVKVARLAGLGALGVGISLFLFAGVLLVAPLVGASVDGDSNPDSFRSGLFIFAAVTGAVHVGIWKLLPTIVPDSGIISVFGLLHPVADALKLFWKEDFIPTNADKFLHSAAPIIALVPAIATMAVVPFGPTFFPEISMQPIGTALQGVGINLQVATLNVGILYMFAIAGTGVVGAAVAGYSSDNKYSLLGGLRAAGQMVSYEVTLGLSLVGCFILFDTLRLEEMVEWQRTNGWGLFYQPLAFFLFFCAAIAETKRVPFDVPEGESELVGGYFTEYSGMKFAMFMTGEFVEVITSSALIVTIFLGGYHLPGGEWLLGVLSNGYELARWVVPGGEGEEIVRSISIPAVGSFFGTHIAFVLLGVGVWMAKLVFMLWFQLTVRWALPRFRYDQIMKLCWTVLLPLSLANILVTALLVQLDAFGYVKWIGVVFFGALLFFALRGTIIRVPLVSELVGATTKKLTKAST